MKMLAHHQKNMKNKAVPIIQQAVKKDLELFIEARARVTAVLYAMCKAIVRFDTWLRKISCFTNIQGARNADTEGGMEKQVRKE